MCGIWTKRSLLSRQYLRLHHSLRIKARLSVPRWTFVCKYAHECGALTMVLFINKKSALLFFFYIYISVYFWLIGPQASRSPSCRISRVSRRSTFYFITPSKGMRGLISLGLTLRLLWETLSDQIFRPQQTPIIRIMASHGNKEKRGKTLPKHLNLFFLILF